MPRRCYVEWCFSGYDSENKINKVKNKRNNAVFQAPKDPELRQKWHEAIGRTNRVLSERDAVCELHFAKSDVQRFYETLMPDGTIHRISRRCSLKPGATPNMNISKESATDLEFKSDTDELGGQLVLEATENTTEKIKEEDNEVTIDVDSVQERCATVTICNKVAVQQKNIAVQPLAFSNDLIVQKSDGIDLYTIENLRFDLTRFCLPEGWAFLCLKEEIRFPFWNLKSGSTMTVTIKDDMTGMISVPEGVTRGTDRLNLTSFDNFAKSLISLSKYMCEGSGTKSRRDDQCSILIPYSGRFPSGYRSNRCLPCRVLRKDELSSEKREKTRRDRILEYQKSLISVKRQNARLRIKVLKLQATLDHTRRSVSLSMKKLSKKKYLYCPYHNSGQDVKINDNCIKTSSTL